METAYVVDSVRTPVARYGGGLSTVRPDDMLAFVLKALLERNAAVDVNDIEDVIAGASGSAPLASVLRQLKVVAVRT